MAELSALLSQLDSDVHVRGKDFERICRWYLTNAPQCRHQLKSVSLRDDWPSRWGADVGIDLAARD